MTALDQRIDGIKVTPAIGLDIVRRQIADANARYLPQIHQHPDWREGKACCIVGGGPSIYHTLPQLQKMSNVMVAGSMHDWAIEHDLFPRWCVLVDPDPVMANYLRKPRNYCTYFVASQCHPKTFDALYGERVYVWHAGDDTADHELFGRSKLLIGGGCTVGTRAIFIAKLLGFTNVHLFGMDTCLEYHESGNGATIEHHAYGFTDASETIGRVQPVNVNGKTFMMADYHLGQLFDFKEIVEMHPDLKFTIWGGGPLAEIVHGAAQAAA